MKLKKLLAAVVSGALALSAMAVSSLPVSAADTGVTVNVHIDTDLQTVIFTGKDESVTVNSTPITTSYWNQCDKANKDGSATEYTGAFSTSTETGCTSKFTFSTTSTNPTISFLALYWCNDHSQSEAYEVVAPLGSAVNGVLDYKVVNNGEPATVQTNDWYYITPHTGTVLTSGGGDPIPPTPAGGEAKITFPTGEISLDVIDASTWGDPNCTKAAQITQDANFDGVTYGTTTFGEFKNAYSKITLDGITYKNNSLDADASKFTVSVFAQGGNWSIWKAKDLGKLDSISSSVSVNVADLFGDASDTAEIQKIGFQITCKGGTDVPAIESMALGDKVTVNSASTPKPPTPPTPDDSLVIWEGTHDFSTTWDKGTDIPAENFADLIGGATLKFTFTKGTADFYRLQIVANYNNWADKLSSIASQVDKDNFIAPTESPFSFVINEADVALLQEHGMGLNGYGITLTKIEAIFEGGDVESCTHEYGDYQKDSAGHWKTCTICGEATAKEAHSFTNNVCTVCGYETAPVAPVAPVTPTVPIIPDVSAPVIPFNNFNPNKGSSDPTISGSSDKSGWSAIESEISGAADGGKVSVDMNKSTKLPKSVVSAIEGTDVDLVLTMSNGIKWTINGKNVDNAKSVDMGVSTNTHNIPTDVIKAINGKSYSRQLSLDYDGSFGFTATMTISLGKVNNGLYANLYYYNPDSKELEFVDCGLIENGSANLVFRHASDYAIVIDEEPLGTYDDVSAAAGITSSDDTVGTNSAVYPVAVLVIAALGIAAGKKFSRQK